MTSTVKTVTRQTVTRSLLDLDPKVAVFAVVALVVDVAAICLYLTGQITAVTLLAALGPSGLGTILGYAKTSTHAALVDEIEQGVGVVARVAPLVESAFPAAKPVIDEAEGILSSLGLADLASAPSEATPTVSTGTLQVSANGGGQ